jgi:hypothetical protein
MPTQDEIEAELRAMVAARQQVNQGTPFHSWVNGCIYTLSWLSSEDGAMPPSHGFSTTIESRPELRRGGPASSRKDPTLP